MSKSASDSQPAETAPKCDLCDRNASWLHPSGSKRCQECMDAVTPLPNLKYWKGISTPPVPPVAEEAKPKCPKCNGIPKSPEIEGCAGCMACDFIGTLEAYERMEKMNIEAHKNGPPADPVSASNAGATSNPLPPADPSTPKPCPFCGKEPITMTETSSQKRKYFRCCFINWMNLYNWNRRAGKGETINDIHE